MENSQPYMLKTHYLKVYQCPFNKKRFGSKHDGGYVVCETNVQYDALISGGVSNDINFENDFLKLYNVPAYAFDHTIRGVPKNQYASTKLQWISKKIGRTNNGNETNLKEYINKFRNIFLKIDINNGEYPLFKALKEHELQRISQITMEIHGVYKGERLDIFKILNKTHTLFHAHANNYCMDYFIRDNCKIPHLLEVTLVRNSDLISHFPNYKHTLNTIRFPHHCDSPNNSKGEELDINFYPFLALDTIA